MQLFQHSASTLPLCLILLVLQVAAGDVSATTPSSNGVGQRVLPRLVKRAHDSAVRRTHSLARDLRVALGSVLPRAETPALMNDGRAVVYCKTGGSQGVLKPPTDEGNGENGDGSEGSEANSTVASGPTSSTRGGGGGAATSTRTRSSTSQPQPTQESPWRLTNSYVCCFPCYWMHDC